MKFTGPLNIQMVNFHWSVGSAIGLFGTPPPVQVAIFRTPLPQCQPLVTDEAFDTRNEPFRPKKHPMA